MKRNEEVISDAVHLIENLFALALDLHTYFISDGVHVFLQLQQLDGRTAHIYYHHHVEVALNDGLRDVHHADVVRSEVIAHLGNNAHCVFA